tara:strand:+ start:753 stop:944 length:192 start_codon:yes stop_codon:yes gene_type:complete
MIKCPKCKEIIGPSAPVYKASRGFLWPDGSFTEDEAVIIHMDCSYCYTINPFDILEDKIKESR